MSRDAPAPEFVPVAPFKRLKEGIGCAVVVNGRGVALFLRDGVCYAVSERCPHNGMSLSDGSVEGRILTCRWHGWQFDIQSGRPPGAPEGAEGPCIRTYPVRVRDGWVLRRRSSG